MAGVDELHGDAGRHGHRPVVADRLQQRHRAVGVFRREERQRRLMVRVALAVRALRVFFLQLGRVGEHDARELGGGRRAEDAAAKPLADEPRQVAAVIEMRVRQDDGVDRRSRESATDASCARAVP